MATAKTRRRKTSKKKTQSRTRIKKVRKAAMSLAEFMRAERQKGCPVCALPKHIKEQLQEAPEKKIKVADRVLWLNEVCGADVTISDLTTHVSARHDYN